MDAIAVGNGVLAGLVSITAGWTSSHGDWALCVGLGGAVSTRWDLMMGASIWTTSRRVPNVVLDAWVPCDQGTTRAPAPLTAPTHALVQVVDLAGHGCCSIWGPLLSVSCTQPKVSSRRVTELSSEARSLASLPSVA